MSVDHAPQAERLQVDGVHVLGAISPSRASDFMTCPLMFRFRTIDRLPETSSVDAVRGTLVHKVLEDLFSLPAAERTPERARAMLGPTWDEFVVESPELPVMFESAAELEEWMASAADVLDRYFTLEDPQRLEPAERELYVEALLDSKLLLRGYIDRLDVAPDGAIRISDYKGLAVDTPLPTPTGWTTMGDVAVGDELIAADGMPTVVTSKSGVHHRPCFRVTLRDGTSVVSDNVHLWTVVTSRRQRETRRTVDTAQLYELHRGLVREGRPRSLWIESGEAFEADDIDLPIDPWLLGAWLGDGDTRGGALTVGAADLDDMLVKVKERWPFEVRVRQERTAFRVTMSKDPERCTFGHTTFRPPTPGHAVRRCALEGTHGVMGQPINLSFGGLLRRSGLVGDKHIPAAYLRAGTSQRIDLLRGLMDGDGWWNRTRLRAGLTTTDDRLAADVMELLRSLGIHPEHFVKPYVNAVRAPRNRHILEFTPKGFNPFSLPRKASEAAIEMTPLRYRLMMRRVVASVEPMASVPTQCVAVDSPDSLYLAGEGFIPTHNTGNSPVEDYEAKALFQMKFYALAIWRSRGVIPKVLQLVYLGNGEILKYEPDEADLVATERKVNALWDAIRAAEDARDWQPNRSRACDWCSFKAACPEWGGTPPPVPEERLRRGAARPRGPRWFGRLRRWWRRSRSGGPSRSSR